LLFKLGEQASDILLVYQKWWREAEKKRDTGRTKVSEPEEPSAGMTSENSAKGEVTENGGGL